jgi:hypothetical protein
MRRLALSLFLASLVAMSVGCSEDVGDLDAGVDFDGGAPPVWIEEQNVPTDEDLLGVWGRAVDDVYAVGWNGTVVHWDGTTWTEETTTTTVALTAVHGLAPPPPMDPPDPNPPPPGPVFAVGHGGTILVRSGGEWIDAAPTSTHTDDLFDVFVGADDMAIAVGDSGRVMAWDGLAWTKITMYVRGDFSSQLIEPKSTLQAVWSGNGRRFYIAGSGGAAYRSTGGAQNFELLDTFVSTPLRDLWGVASNDVFAVGLDSLIMRFNGGWRRVRNDGADELPRRFLFGISGLNGSDITIVGWDGLIVRYLDGAWFQEVTLEERDFRSVWVDPVSEVAFAVGASGMIMRRDPPPPPEDMMMP